MSLATIAELPVDLPAGDKRGHRYTPAQREGAFSLYAALRPPCLATTAACLGIGERTVRLWAKRDDWPGRYQALMGEHVTGVDGKLSAANRVDAIADRMLRQIDVLSLVALVQTLSNETARDRVRAIELGLGLNHRVVPKVGIALTQHLDATPLDPALLASLSPSQLAAYARTGVLPATTESTRVDSPLPSPLDVIDVEPGPDIP